MKILDIRYSIMKCSPVDQVLSLCFTQNVPFFGG